MKVGKASAVEDEVTDKLTETVEAPASVSKTAGASTVRDSKEQAPTSKLPAAMRALRRRNYQLFFFGQLISLTGTCMQSVAQSWLIYRLTGSAVLLGLVGFASQIPVFLLAPVGEGWCFFANAVSYVAVIAGLLMMKLTVARRGPSRVSAFASIVEGFRFVAHTAPVRALLLLLGLISLMGMPYAVLMPIFADQILHGGASGLGLLMGASGVGALAGALSLAARNGLRGLGRWVAISSAGFGVSVILFSMSRSFWLSAALLLPVGFSMMIEMASSNTLIQAMVPDALRGRVMAVYSMMFMGMAPIGALLAGALAQRLGAPNTVALGGSVCIIGALVFGLRLPALRAEAREIIVALQMAGGDPPEEMTTGEYAALAPRKA